MENKKIEFYFGILLTYSYLCTQASRAVIFGWTRQPSNGSHGGQYDVEDLTNRMQYQTRLNIAEVRINLDVSQE